MATISSVTGQSTSTPTTPTATADLKGNQELGRDDFLTLLVTQLKNQDPLKPMESTAFVAELAQFSQLEQSSKQVQLLQQSITNQTDSLQYSLLPMVGRTVQVEGSVIDLKNGPATLTYALGGDASAVKVTIMDQQGKAIRTLDLGSQGAGKQEVQWDGRNQNGSLMPAGLYQYRIAAKDVKGSPVVAASSSILTITGVRMVNGTPQLVAGDQVIDRSNIVELR